MAIAYQHSSRNAHLKIVFIIIACLLFVLTILHAVKGLRINEIMFNPDGADTGREWVEVWGDECTADKTAYQNMSLFTLYENGVNHKISKYDINESFDNQTICDYSILCSDCAKFNIDYPSINNTYKSSFSLNNDGEEISLEYNGSIIDTVNYSLYAADVHEGFSLEFDAANNTWFASRTMGGTPGIVNEEYIVLANDSDNSSINTSMNNTLNMNISENISNLLNDTQNNTQNTTQNITRNTTQECVVTMDIGLKNNSNLFENGVSIKFRNNISIVDNNSAEHTYVIEYWIEDLFGAIIKSKIITENTNEKSYTPNIKEKDAILIIKNRLVNVSCVVSNVSILESQHMILVKNPSYVESICETVSTCGTSTKSSSTGTSKTPSKIASIVNAADPLSFINISQIELKNNYTTIDLNIYRGDTQKTVVELYAIDKHNKSISQKYKFKMLNKYSGINIEFPLYLDTICDSSLRMKGLDSDQDFPLDICENESTTSTIAISSIKASIDEHVVDETLQNYTHNATPLTGNLVYESVNQKNKKYALVGTIIAVIAAILLFIQGRKTKNTAKSV